jgi:hypothetical protein
MVAGLQHYILPLKTSSLLHSETTTTLPSLLLLPETMTASKSSPVVPGRAMMTTPKGHAIITSPFIYRVLLYCTPCS